MRTRIRIATATAISLPASVFMVIAFSTGAAFSQMPGAGVTKPLSAVQWKQDSDVKCLQYAVEAGDPDTGPSTHALSFPKGCAFPWHYHTAEEQLVVVKGRVSVQMGSGAPALLDAGGFAVMPSKELHRFSCVYDNECAVFVHFDRAYDIFWKQVK